MVEMDFFCEMLGPSRVLHRILALSEMGTWAAQIRDPDVHLNSTRNGSVADGVECKSRQNGRGVRFGTKMYQGEVG
jgi:hypothetical protein